MTTEQTNIFRTVFATVALFICITGTAQQFSFKQYTVKDGLPSSTIYYALQDRNGFMWFASNQGVSRFDGHTFRNFTKEDGLPDNEIIKMYLDKHNNVWFISMLGVPALYRQ